MRKKHREIETAGLDSLPTDYTLTRRQVRYLLAGTASDAFIYQLFLRTLREKIVQIHGDEFLKAGDISAYIKA